MSFGALVRSLLARLRQAIDRFRVRRFARLGLPLVRDALDGDPRALPASPAALRMPVRIAPEDGPDYQAPDSPLRWLAGEAPAPLRLASTRALSPPPRELAVLRLEAFRLPARRLPFDRTPKPVTPLGQARPEVFGVDEERTRVERAVPPALADVALPRVTVRLEKTARLPAPDPLGLVAPEAFGLATDGSPATELEPLPPRQVMRLSRAHASFLFRFTEPMSVERILSPAFTSPVEGLEEKLEPLFNRPAPGAGEPVESQVDGDVAAALDEVREQFLLRRGIGRVEVDDSELGALTTADGFTAGAMTAFTGLTFESLQPEPVEPLKMRLANPPVDMTPTLDASADARAMFVRALADFTADPQKPPPELPTRGR